MLIPVLLLLSLGVAVIYSSNHILATNQFFFGLLGLLCFLVIRYSDYRSYKFLIKPSYFLIIICLIITFLIGNETRGSVRWIPIGPFNFQPSEFAKPVLILILADFWSKRKSSWANILKSLLILAPIAALIFRQPDLGTTLTVVFIWFFMLMAANLSFVKLGILSLLGAISAPVVWLFMEDYQKQRMFAFLSPSSDPQGIGFHVIQSMIAVGSGQFFGRGLGRGTQSRLQFLPEFRTDFIFAFIAEELGLIGSMVVLVLYSILVFIFFRILSRTGDRFGELVIFGTLGMLFFQTVINIGMNVGVLPITGITLPLLSYGGSSVISTFICLGLVASIAKFGSKRQDVKIFDTL